MFKTARLRERARLRVHKTLRALLANFARLRYWTGQFDGRHADTPSPVVDQQEVGHVYNNLLPKVKNEVERDKEVGRKVQHGVVVQQVPYLRCANNWQLDVVYQYECYDYIRQLHQVPHPKTPPSPVVQRWLAVLSEQYRVV